MMDWTQDERTAALMAQAVAHAKEFDEFSLEHEEQLELIRDEYMWERSNDYRGESADAFGEWHGQPTVEEAFHAEFNA